LLQRLLAPEKVHGHLTHVIDQEVCLGGEVQLASQGIRVQPAGDEMVEVTVAGNQRLGLQVARAHRVATQIGVGRVGALQRVTYEGKFEAALTVLGKLLLIPVIRQMPRPAPIEKCRAHAAASAFGHMDEYALVSLEGRVKRCHPRQGFVHGLSIHHRQTPQQKHPLVLGKQLPQ